MSRLSTPRRPVDLGKTARARPITWRGYALIFLAALLARAGWGTYRLSRAENCVAVEFPDEQQYWATACDLWNGLGLHDELGFRATRMPLYPALLAPFTALTHGVIAAKAVHWLLGTVVAVMAAGLATTLFDRRVGWLAGAFVSFDPFLIFFSSLLLTETAFLCAVTALWWSVSPAIGSNRMPAARWLLVAALGAVCVYLRESSLGLFVLMAILVVSCRRFDRRAIFGATAALLFVVISLIPWAARNRQVTGQWRWLTTRAGISLYDGVGPRATGGSDLGDIKQSSAVRGMDEIQWDRHFMSESIRAIKSDPARIARLAVVKFARMWNPLPNVQTYQSPFVRFVSAAWTIPIFLLAVVGAAILAIRRGRGGRCWVMFLLLPAVYLSLLHSLFVGSVRYRLGAMPMLEILAAFALTAVLDRTSRRPVPPEVVRDA